MNQSWCELGARVFSPSRFIRQVTSTFSVQVILLLVSVVNGALIARWFGTDGKGTLQLVLLVPTMFGLLLAGGIGIANVHYLGGRQYDLSELTSNSVWFALVAGVVATGAFVFGAMTGIPSQILPGVPMALLALAMFGLPVSLLIGYWSALLQGLHLITTLNGVKVIAAFANLVLTLLFVLVLQQGIAGIIYASLLSGMLNLHLLAWMLRRRKARLLRKWDRDVMLATLRFGLRGQVGNILQYFNYRLDVFIVNIFLGTSSVGIYSVSTRLAELVWYFPNAVSFVIFPKAASTSESVMNRFTPRVFRWTLAIAVLGAIGIAVIGRPLIRLVYTDAFLSAYLPLLLLLPGVVLLGAGRVLTSDIAGRGFPQYNSMSAGLALIVTVALDILWIPRLGINGAALASTAAYIVTFAVSVFFYIRVSRRASGGSGAQERVSVK